MTAAKHSVPLPLSTLVIAMLAMFLAVSARADDVTFLDGSETLTASTTSSRITIPACGFQASFGGITGLEGCQANVSAPSGSTWPDTRPTTFFLFVGEADGTISDIISIDAGPPFSASTRAFVRFLSGIPASPGSTCNAVGGCLITEDGTVQQLGPFIQWVDNAGNVTTDTIRFQSDVNVETPPVPEPASLTLLGSGLLAIAGYIRRRLA